MVWWTVFFPESTVVHPLALFWKELFVVPVLFGHFILLQIMCDAFFFIAQRINVFWVLEKLVKCPHSFESVIVIDVLIIVDEAYNKPPQTPNIIGNNKSDEYQPDDFVGVHDHLLGLEPVGSVGFIKIVLN